MNKVMTTKSLGGNNKPAVDPSLLLNNPQTAKTLTKEQVENLTESEALRSGAIQARTLRMPTEFNIMPKHKEYAYRWVNHKARGGANYSKFLMSGFSNATQDDVDVVTKESIQPDGSIQIGDVILMKMPKEQYYGILKGNLVRSQKMVSRQGIADTAREQAVTTGTGPDLRLFVPSAESVERAAQFRESGAEIKVGV